MHNNQAQRLKYEAPCNEIYVSFDLSVIFQADALLLAGQKISTVVNGTAHKGHSTCHSLIANNIMSIIA